MASIELEDVSLEIPVFDYGIAKLLRGRSAKLASSARHANAATFKALSGVSVSLSEGDRLGIVGRNGAGKTSLLRLVSGVYAPTKGRLEISGKITSLLDISFGIEPELTGRESIYLRARILGVSRKDIEPREHEIVDFSGLGEFIDLPTRTYSSGMFVRLAFAISTILEPEILVMDEWLSVGDEEFRDRAEARLKTLVSESKILILASHSRELIEHTCNKAIWIENGQIRRDGTSKDVCAAYFSRKDHE